MLAPTLAGDSRLMTNSTSSSTSARGLCEGRIFASENLASQELAIQNYFSEIQQRPFFGCFLKVMSSKVAGKRKRVSPAASALMVYRPYGKPYTKRRRTFRAGYDRVGGFYGRYAGRNAELKFHDVDLDDAVVAVAGAVVPTAIIIPQGVTESQRVGRKCTIRSINWRYQLTLPEQDAVASPAASDSIRMIVFIDKQANGATATATDILESDSWKSFRNLANSGRFTILMDKVHNLNYPTLASDGAGVVSSASYTEDHMFYKTCNIPIEYSSTTGAIGEIRSNNISIFTMSSNGVCGFSSKWRVRFSDQ